jgi:hypothetical protein
MMNENDMPVTIVALENWMKEHCFNFNSYSINGNAIHEGYVIVNNGGLFSWCYTERGQQSVLKYFRSEQEIIAYAFDELKADTWADRHCIGFTSDKGKANELCGLLKDMNVGYKEDSIPYIERRVYRTFVSGCDIRKTEHLKAKYYEVP